MRFDALARSLARRASRRRVGQGALAVAAGALLGRPVLARAAAPTPTPAPSKAPGVSGNSYASPTYDFTLKWDNTWRVTGASSAGGTDELALNNGTSAVSFQGAATAKGDPAAGLQQTVKQIFDPKTTRNVTLMKDASGKPLQGQTSDRAYAVYTYQQVANGATQQRAAYLDCRALVPGYAILLIAQDVAQAAYSSQTQPLQTLLNNLAMPLAGVKFYTGLSHLHTTGRVTYPQVPPVGGPHNPIWQNCGYYSQPVANEHAVHSLEHGAAWITYQPNLPADQVAILRKLAQSYTYVLVSPYPGLPTPVVASAWGVQLKLPGVNEAQLRDFILAYRFGPDTEKGAPCSGGWSSTNF
ncbi:MAG TPA: DUF3105 domain-containing protein [Dehalococcoidia bacterium]|nr:DUF3105 domain-containing protein [Dehalococcoidia bacterium]